MTERGCGCSGDDQHRDGIGYWWLSFVDRVSDGDYSAAMQMGCAIVMAASMDEAIQEAWAYSINPGGEVAAMQLPRTLFPAHADRRRFTYRLLQGAEITEAQVAITAEKEAAH